MGDRLRANAAIYGTLVGARIRSDWQYRTSFFLFLVGQALASGLDLAAIAVIFGQVDELAGWSGADVALLFGVTATGFGLGDVFFSQVETVDKHVRDGTFDVLLLRPVSPMLQLCATEFALRRVGRVIQPLIVAAIALWVADIDWSLARVVMVPLAIVSGAAIFSAIWVVTNSIAFWTVDARESANSFTYGGITLSEYPIDVFSNWLRRFVVFILPIAFTGYFPVAWLLDKPVPGSLPSSAAWASPAVALACVLVARAVWGTAIRHYRSTGS